MDHIALNQKTLVVILGGGRGTRLYPLTKFRSKPAVPFAGKYRLIDIPISNCLHSGINRMFVLTQFHSASLNRHIARTFNFDTFTKGFVEVLAAEQTIISSEWFQGTADAVRKICPHIMNQAWEQVLILSGDHLYRMDYRPFLQYHMKKGADMTVCTLGVDEDAAGDLGILKANKSGRINAFKEKPGPGQVDDMKLDTTSRDSFMKGFNKPLLASMGIYIVNRDVLKPILFDDPLLHDFGKQIIPGNLKQKRVYAYPFEGYWEDIGGIRSFFDANMNLCREHPPFKLIHPTFPIYTHHRHLSGAAVIESQVTNCIINEGSIIRNAVLKNSVIGLRSRIEAGVHVEKSLLFGADYYKGEEIAQGRKPGIGKNTRINNAIIEKNAQIGHNVVIENKKGVKEYDDPEERYYIREGIVIVVKNAIIPDNTVI
ncbi:MAG: glucose-1-phosphate adenylyltransferase [Thermodesulfobacteriota bacterium]